MQRAATITHADQSQLGPLAQAPQRVSEDTPSIESDTSEHSYHLTVRPRRTDGRGSRSSAGSGGSGETPFGADNLQATPIPRDSLEEARQARHSHEGDAPDTGPHGLSSINERKPSNEPSSSLPTPHARMAAFKDYRAQIGTKSAFSLELPPHTQESLRRGIRVSVDMPRTTSGHSDVPVARELVGRLIKHRRRLPIHWVIIFGSVSTVSMCVALTTLGIGIFNFTKLRQNRSQKSVQGLENDLEPILGNITAAIQGVQLGVDALLSMGGRPMGPQG